MSGTDPGNSPRENLRPQMRAALWGGRALGYVVYAYVLVTEIILGLGFVLLLFGANPNPAFVQWVYRSLDRAMEPFRGIFTDVELGLTGPDNVQAKLDTSVVFAMIVYALVAWAVHAFIGWMTYRLQLLEREERDAANRAAGYPPPGQPPTPPEQGYRGYGGYQQPPPGQGYQRPPDQPWN